MAKTWFIREGEGTVFELSLPLHEDIVFRLHKGYLRRVNKDGSDYTERAERSRPAVNAAKTEWVAWAVHCGCAPDDADVATKSDLIEKYGL